MNIREARIEDIEKMEFIRNSVKENILLNPALITAQHYEQYISQRGKGWVCEIANEIVGFSVIDLQENNVWALFMNQDFEGKGIGKKLHQAMLDWYFSKTTQTVWLSTSPKTRAENFYRKLGWKEVGLYGNDEIKFEMDFHTWQQKNL